MTNIPFKVQAGRRCEEIISDIQRRKILPVPRLDPEITKLDRLRLEALLYKEILSLYHGFLLVATLRHQVNNINDRVMPRVVNGVCWFPFGKIVDIYFDIVRRTDILQIIKELHALPSSLKRIKFREDPLKTFLDEVGKHIEKHFG
jgi:hypothetical protein